MMKTRLKASEELSASRYSPPNGMTGFFFEAHSICGR
jgi:hypothetical protein